MIKNRRQTIRLKESDLHRIVKESVNRILRESNNSGIEITSDAEDVALSSDRIRQLFNKYRNREISLNDLQKEIENETSWESLRLNGNGKVNQSKADWAKFLYDTPQGRINKYWFGEKDDPQIPQENPNLLDLHRTY